jgi:hypothetical protein
MTIITFSSLILLDLVFDKVSLYFFGLVSEERVFGIGIPSQSDRIPLLPGCQSDEE